MGKRRLEAFSDAVFAIILTIMVLELKVPFGETFSALEPIVPAFISYVLSFVLIASFWNNHHHLFFATERVSGGVLWANMGLLFFLSLVPASTAWMGGTRFAPVPTTVYAAVELLSSIAVWVLQTAIVATQGKDTLLGKAIGGDKKGKVSLAMLVVATGCAMWVPLLAVALCGVVDVIWLVPDRRIERALAAAETQDVG